MQYNLIILCHTLLGFAIYTHLFFFLNFISFLVGKLLQLNLNFLRHSSHSHWRYSSLWLSSLFQWNLPDNSRLQLATENYNKSLCLVQIQLLICIFMQPVIAISKLVSFLIYIFFSVFYCLKSLFLMSLGVIKTKWKPS